MPQIAKRITTVAWVADSGVIANAAIPALRISRPALQRLPGDNLSLSGRTMTAMAATTNGHVVRSAPVETSEIPTVFCRKNGKDTNASDCVPKAQTEVMEDSPMTGIR